MTRVWIGLGLEPVRERVVATSDAVDDSQTGPGIAAGSKRARLHVLQRTPGSEPARWSVVVTPGLSGGQRSADQTYRVRIEASGDALGSIWGSRGRDGQPPDPVQTRLLAAAADQVGQALARDRVAEEARAADIARQSDALKSSLLQSVSHDFRTPLAVIRAAAGSLTDETALPAVDRRANLAAIDREVEYLNRLVTNLLDLSRIEAGSLRARSDVFDIDDVVTGALDRVRERLSGRSVDVDLAPALVRVDPVFMDAALGNLLENELRYTPDGTRIRLSARVAADHSVVLTVEDAGPGVPPDAIPRLFERFYRVPGVGHSSRGGLGIGLSVTRGLVEAMGGSVRARQGSLGGLAIDLELPSGDVSRAATGGVPTEAVT